MFESPRRHHFLQETQSEARISFLKILAGLLIGAVCSAAIALVLSEIAAAVFNISQMEGAYAMGVVFFYMPLGAVIGGIIGAIWMAARASKQKQ